LKVDNSDWDKVKDALNVHPAPNKKSFAKGRWIFFIPLLLIWAINTFISYRQGDMQINFKNNIASDKNKIYSDKSIVTSSEEISSVVNKVNNKVNKDKERYRIANDQVTLNAITFSSKRMNVYAESPVIKNHA